MKLDSMIDRTDSALTRLPWCSLACFRARANTSVSILVCESRNDAQGMSGWGCSGTLAGGFPLPLVLPLPLVYDVGCADGDAAATVAGAETLAAACFARTSARDRSRSASSLLAGGAGHAE